jgi:hypothetical protein
MEIVLFVNLSFQLTICGKSEQIRILFPRHLRWIHIRLSQCFTQYLYRSASIFHLLLHGVLEIAREILDLFYLLLQITAQARQSKYNIILDRLRAVGFDRRCLMVIAQDFQGVIDAAGRHEY